MESCAQAPSPTTADRYEAFARDIAALRKRIEAELGEEDLAHLRKVERWGRIATAVGLATCWVAPNPVSAVALSLGRSTRWLLMHHVGHRGYDKVPGVPPEYTSRVFARGKRRRLDWNDWMVPEAWIYEHNVLHHAHTGEEDDPDLVERNTEELRAPWLPKLARYATVGLLGATWRVTYYAPKTIATWMRRHGPVDDTEVRRTLVWECYVPYALWHFAALPAAYLPLGPWAAASALVNSIAADVLTNMHTFFVVGPNHTGDDIYRFDARPRSRAEHVVRQVVGSVNYRTGGDARDYLHLFLNYQIEHHLFPDLPMRQYQRIQPEVRAICEEHGVPYVQEGVVARFKKLVRVVVGDAKMRRVRDIAAGITAA